MAKPAILRTIGAQKPHNFAWHLRPHRSRARGMVSDAVAIMTDEDYAEFERLAEIATAEDTLEFRALYEGS